MATSTAPIARVIQTGIAWTVIVNGRTVCVCHSEAQARKVAGL